MKAVNTGVRELARQAGCSPALVSRKLSAGKTAEQIIAEAQELNERRAARELEAAASPAPGAAAAPNNGGPGAGEPVEKFSEAQRRKECALANLRELELAEKRGELVSATDAAVRMAEICQMIRESMMSIPTRVASRLAAMTNEAEIAAELRKEIKADLARVSEVLDNDESAHAA